eukprot:snap_masked-scaffold_31-processed-gene-1.36-mRNA-1 protein AED:1.00 eAED:1.00 QI:0/0/0/0/1/1/2/0/224
MSFKNSLSDEVSQLRRLLGSSYISIHLKNDGNEFSPSVNVKKMIESISRKNKWNFEIEELTSSILSNVMKKFKHAQIKPNIVEIKFNGFAYPKYLAIKSSNDENCVVKFIEQLQKSYPSVFVFSKRPNMFNNYTNFFTGYVKSNDFIIVNLKYRIREIIYIWKLGRIYFSKQANIQNLPNVENEQVCFLTRSCIVRRKLNFENSGFRSSETIELRFSQHNQIEI